VYLVTIAFGVVGTVCAAFSTNVDKLMTSHVDIKLEEGAHVHARNMAVKDVQEPDHENEGGAGKV
jgi:hypothetical protein